MVRCHDNLEITDMCSTVPACPPDASCCVPSGLNGRHDPSALTEAAAMESVWNLLKMKLVEPVTVHATKSQRTVVFLDLFTLVVDYRKNRIDVYKNSNGTLVRMQRADIDLLSPLNYSMWLDYVIQDQWPNLTRRQVRKVALALECRIEEMIDFCSLSSLLRNALDLRAIQIRQAVAKSKTIHDRYTPVYSLKTFNLFWQHADAVLVVEQRAPSLLPLLRLALESSVFRKTIAGDPIVCLGEYLQGIGLTPAAWQRVLRTGCREIRVGFHSSQGECELTTIVSYLNFLEDLGINAVPPKKYYSLWLNSFRDAAMLLNGISSSYDAIHRIILRAGCLCSDGEMEAFFLDYVLVVMCLITKKLDMVEPSVSWPELRQRAYLHR